MSSPTTRRPGRAPAPALVLAAGLLWGTTGTAQALGPDDATSLGVGALRLLIGGGALVAVAVARGTARWPRSATPSLLLAAAGVAAYQPFFFAGVRATGVAVGTVVAIGSGPVLAGLLAWAFRRERPGAAWAAATALAIAGCLVLAAAGAPADVDLGGIVLALGAGLSYSTYAVATKSLLAHLDPVRAAAWTFGVAALVLSPVLIVEDVSWVVTPAGAAMAAHLGLVATTGSYLLFTRGLTGLPVATAATLSLAEPVTASILGITVLGERPSPLVYGGMALVLIGLAVAARASGRALSRPRGRRRPPGTRRGRGFPRSA